MGFDGSSLGIVEVFDALSMDALGFVDSLDGLLLESLHHLSLGSSCLMFLDGLGEPEFGVVKSLLSSSDEALLFLVSSCTVILSLLNTSVVLSLSALSSSNLLFQVSVSLLSSCKHLIIMLTGLPEGSNRSLFSFSLLVEELLSFFKLIIGQSCFSGQVEVDLYLLGTDSSLCFRTLHVLSGSSLEGFIILRASERVGEGSSGPDGSSEGSKSKDGSHKF